MNSFRYKLATFMHGRYGIDQLYYGLLVTYVIFIILNIIFPSFIWGILMTASLVYALFRMFSKNIAARQRENRVFLKLWNPLKTELVLCKDRCKDFRTARYRHCKHCRAIIKLPKKRGKHTVICPCCKERFSVRIIL
ncbi:MAG: hypothetical protein IJ325_02925 [Clostridia bacterium]|nr:hypothetical protein [Clostridia bacterium]